MSTAPRLVGLPGQELSLPGWLYRDPEYFAVEMERVIRPSWQIVCHASDIAQAGDWRTLDYLGESILVIRGGDGAIRAFANVCRHRGSRVVSGGAGCAKRLTCPYHAWTYGLDGRLIGVPRKSEYPGLDTAALGLAPVELEQWRGFQFVRLAPGGPSVAAMMAPYEAEIDPYRFEALEAIGRVTLRPRAVNWKNVADNYSDGLHIEVAHPGLTRLFGRGYGVEAEAHVDRMHGDLLDRPSDNVSERAYQAMLPEVAHLPASHQRRWLYFKLWPNNAFDIYPDQVDFMQFLPVSPTETMIREISYAVPDGRREMRAARYLNWRINRRVNAEDTALIAGVQAGMGSASYTPGPLGESEVCLRSFARKLRRIIPEAKLDRPPPPGWSGLKRGPMTRDPRIDSYIARQADFARPILEHLRAAVHAACPDCEETLKWSMPTFMYKGQILASMAAFKAHATFGFWKGSLVIGDGEEQKSAMGQFGRLASLDDLPLPAVLDALIGKAIALADTGAKVKRPVKHPKPPVETPPDLAAALNSNPAARATFDAFPPSCRRDYVHWIVEAKREETRSKRLAQAVEWMAEGKKRHWKYENC